MALNPLSLKDTVAAGVPGRYADAGGLRLTITPAGSALWQYKYRVAGREKVASFGAYPTVSLAAARVARDNFKAAQREGRDPNAEKKAKVAAEKRAAASTFAHFADQVLAQRKLVLDPETYVQWERQLGAAKAAFGERPIAAITAADVLEFLLEVQAAGKVATSNRMKQKIGATFRRAALLGACAGDPTAVLKGELAATVSTPRAAITDPKRFGALLRAIWNADNDPATVAGMKLLALTAQRPHMVREMRWCDLDLEAGLWTLEAEQMKGEKGKARAHVVPLSPQAVAVIESMRPHTGDGELVVPGRRLDAEGRALPMERGTLIYAIHALGFKDHSAHGFRASFYSLGRERLEVDEKVLDLMLAHVEENEVRRAYDRSEFVEQRAAVARDWADYLDRLRASAEVVPLRAATSRGKKAAG